MFREERWEAGVVNYLCPLLWFVGDGKKELVDLSCLSTGEPKKEERKVTRTEADRGPNERREGESRSVLV